MDKLTEAVKPRYTELIEINKELVDLNKSIVEQLEYQVTATYKVLEAKENQNKSDKDWRDLLTEKEIIESKKKRISFYLSWAQLVIGVTALYFGLIDINPEVVEWLKQSLGVM